MVLVFYLLCIVSMMMIRPCLNRGFLKKGKTAIYNSLYFIPVLSLFHTVAGGLICKSMPRCTLRVKVRNICFTIVDYSFPYLSVIISMISNAAHFSLKLDQSMKSLILSSVKEMKNTVVIGMYTQCCTVRVHKVVNCAEIVNLKSQFLMQCLKSMMPRIWNDFECLTVMRGWTNTHKYCLIIRLFCFPLAVMTINKNVKITLPSPACCSPIFN